MRVSIRQGWATRFAAGLYAAISAALRFPLRSLSPPFASLTARSACPAVRCAHRRVPDRHARCHIRRHRARHRRVLLATALHAVLVANLASLALAGCAGGGLRLGSLPAHFVRRRCGLRPSPCSALRRAPVSAPVRTSRPVPPAACCARLPAAPDAPPAAHAPRRLPSAGFAGVDSPVAQTARWPFRTARGGLGSHTPRSSLQGLPWVSMSGHFRDFRRLWTPGYCWIERMSHRHTLFIISTAAPGCACQPPIYAHPETDIRPTYARLSFGRHRCRRLSTTDIRPDSSAPPPRDREIASNALYGQTPCPSPGGW